MNATQSVELSLTSSLGDAGPKIHGFSGCESISNLYHYTLFLHAPLLRELDLDDLLGQEVSVMIKVAGQVPRYVHGLISEISSVGQNQSHRFYEALLIPRVGLLEDQVGYKTFKGKMLAEILVDYLGAFPHRIEFRERHFPHHYAVKYAESSWNHINRLVEEEGCYYTFETDKASTTLVFADSSTLAGAH